MSSHIPELRIRFTKRADGVVILQCVRRDGSITWQRHDKQGVFFSFHDLSHFAVETVLGFRRGFYGLLAEGRDITDTSGKGARGRLPAESIVVEHVVGLFDRERSGGAPPLRATEFNALLEEVVAAAPLEFRCSLTDEELTAVRQRIGMLHDEWAALPPGSSLDLTFDRAAKSRDRG